MDFGSRLKQVRELSGLSQGSFADRIGYSRPYISQLERNLREIPTDRFIDSVCAMFGVGRNWLIAGEGTMRGEETAFIQTVARSLGVIDDIDQKIITIYLRMPKEKREAFHSFLDEFTNCI